MKDDHRVERILIWFGIGCLIGSVIVEAVLG